MTACSDKEKLALHRVSLSSSEQTVVNIALSKEAVIGNAQASGSDCGAHENCRPSSTLFEKGGEEVQLTLTTVVS